MSEVRILDTITVARDAATDWLSELRSEYVPGAEQRGMRLAATWWAHSERTDADAVDIVLLWEIADVWGFWGMRGSAAADPAVANWWDKTDTTVLSRQRRVLADATQGIVL